MIRDLTKPRTRYRLVTALMLLTGLGSALLIYLTAGSTGESSMVDNYEESKRFVHDLELYGGKANVIAHRFSRWFEGLWHGKSLAFTVAFISVAVSLSYFALARLLPADPESRDGNDSDRNDID